MTVLTVVWVMFVVEIVLRWVVSRVQTEFCVAYRFFHIFQFFLQQRYFFLPSYDIQTMHAHQFVKQEQISNNFSASLSQSATISHQEECVLCFRKNLKIIYFRFISSNNFFSLLFVHFRSISTVIPADGRSEKSLSALHFEIFVQCLSWVVICVYQKKNLSYF